MGASLFSAGRHALGLTCSPCDGRQAVPVMQVNVQKLSPVLVEFDVQIDAARVDAELERSYATLLRSAHVKGFRPGKAPRHVISQVFGPRVLAEVTQRLVDESFPQAVSEQKLQPVSAPAIEPQKLIAAQPFNYKARFEVLPEVPEVKFEGLEAKRPKVEVKDEQITEQLEHIRKDFATLEPFPEARPVVKGDVVTIDFDLFVAGKKIADAGAKDFQVELGSGTLLPGIDEGLIGKSVGDTASVNVDMPKQHPHPKLKGKTVTFQLVLKDAKVRVLPALDDELAKDVGEFATLDALQQNIREQLEKAQKEQAENSVAEQLVAELVKSNPIDVPQVLIEQQMRITEQEILQRARMSGTNVPRGLGEDLRAQVRADSEVKVRAGLLMAEIAKKNEIKIGDAELEEGLAELATQSGKNIAKLRAEYREKSKREMLVGMILENKVLDLIESKAKIEES